jgi:nitrate reductase gamma subunit
MRYFTKTDITQVKAYIMGLVQFHPISAAGIDPVFFMHVALVSVLLAYFPFSKLTHMAGVFFSPTRNLPCDTRRTRHENPWNPEKNFLTYPEYEDMYREAMAEAGLPLDKPLDKKSGE